MGCLWAAKIWQHAQGIAQQHGNVQAVTMLLRDEVSLGRWRQAGGVLIHSAGIEQLVPVVAAIIKDTAAPIDTLLLCTKAQDAVQALASVAHLFHGNTQVLLLQNGVKAQRLIADRFPTLKLYCLSTSHGAYLNGEHSVVHAGQSDSYLGPLNPHAVLSTAARSRLLKSLPTVSMNIVWDSNITGRLWTKFAVNCAINALTVIYDCSNGELMKLPAAAAQLRELCAEIERIMHTVPACPQPLALLKKVEMTLEATARNYSSTLQDVRNGRPTEIAYFNGYLAELAQLTHHPCPVNQAILRGFNSIAKRASD